MNNEQLARTLLKLARELMAEKEEPQSKTVTIRQAAEECPRCAAIMRKYGKRRISRKTFERLAAKGDKCGEKGCIRKVKGGFAIMSGKTGKFWRGTKKGGKPGKIRVYPSKEEAQNVLKRYHGWGF